MAERRDPENSGALGRRDYDDDFAIHCLNCDLRKEVKEKVSWKLFIIIISGILAIAGAFISLGTNAAVNGVQSMISTSKETLKAIHDVGDRTTRIEAKQETIINRLNARRERNRRERNDNDSN